MEYREFAYGSEVVVVLVAVVDGPVADCRALPKGPLAATQRRSDWAQRELLVVDHENG